MERAECVRVAVVGNLSEVAKERIQDSSNGSGYIKKVWTEVISSGGGGESVQGVVSVSQAIEQSHPTQEVSD